MSLRSFNKNNLPGAVTRDAKVLLNGIELILPRGMLDEIRDYLFKDISKEYACYLLCGHRKKGARLSLLGCTLIIPEESEYESHSFTSVRLKRSLLVSVLQECERLGLSLIDIHSHPFATDSVGFSSVDEADEAEKSAWFARRLPKCYYGSIVMGSRCHLARVRSANGIQIELPLRIRQIASPLDLRDTSAPGTGRAKPDIVHIRQIQAFGKEGQLRIGRARVGIIGIGGLGAGLAIGLARLGAKNFTLIDPDNVEMHNLNRLAGMTRADGLLSPRKIDLASREIWNIDPKISINRIAADVRESRAWKKLLDLDVLITATDNHASRMFLNVLSQQYLVPQVSVGTLIESNDGEITDACGHVAVMLPGQATPCLMCAKLIDPVEAYYETASLDSRQKAAQHGYIKNFDEAAPAVVHLNGVLLNLALVEIHNLIHGFKDPVPYLFYDMLEQQTYSVAVGTEQCAICGSGGGYFGRGDLVRLTNVFQDLQQ